MAEEWVATEGYWSISCRACGRERKTSLLRASTAWKTRESFEKASRAQGWRLFVGRSRYWYCAEHGPRSGHAWYEVTDRANGGRDA